MNFNDQLNRSANPGAAGRRLVRRPHETPGLESTRVNPQAPHVYNPMNDAQYGQNYVDNSFHAQNVYPYAQPGMMPPTNPNNYSYPAPSETSGFPQANLLTDPVVASAAMQFGQAFVASGRQELEKYVGVSRLKYYFAVDTAYVSKKLSIILFPYLHSDWSVKYDQNEPIQPKFEVNAPDLYIPTMAFLTYILVAGFILGVYDRFSPEKLSIEALNALAWNALEVLVQLITLYISNINTNLKTYDLLAYSSYKYIAIIVILLTNLLFGRVGYLISLTYLSASLAFFLMRTLKLQILAEPVPYQQDMYGIPQPAVQQLGLKRRQYFLLFVSCSQVLLIWWLTWRIV